MKLLAVVVVLVGGFWLWTNHERHALEHRLGGVASELAGRKVGVKCQGFWAAMVDIQERIGDVQFTNGRAGNSMFLTRGVCGHLRSFSSHRSHHDIDCLETIDWSTWSLENDFDAPCERHARPTVEAINTLTHESMHLRGFISESQAQCYAIELDAWTVMRLGGTEAEGDAVAAYLLALQPALPDDYQSANCRAGGAYDLWPATAAFPSESPPQLPPPTLIGQAAA